MDEQSLIIDPNDWRVPTSGEAIIYDNPVLVAESDDGSLLSFYCEDGIDGMITVEYILYRLGHRPCSSRSTQDWPSIERYLPRERWLCYAGKNTRHQVPDPIVVEAYETCRDSLSV